MKAIITLFFMLSMSVAVSQNMFVHTATAGNISADASFIDHPDLNNNPGAHLLVSHNWNPSGATGVYNTEATGLFYSDALNQWSVYNESGASMIEGASFNIYFGDSSDISLHIADAANVGSLPGYSVINHPDANNNPNALIVLSTYYNPNSLRNNHNYGVWYDEGDGRWNIYTEDFADIPLDSAFFVGVNPTTAATAKHVATAGNISSNWTVIDHPLLNGDPDAMFVFTHNWGTSGTSANVVMDNTMGVWYDGSNWAIFTEDLTAMPQDAEFDIYVFDPTLSVTDNSIDGLTYFPNPVQSSFNLNANTEISSVVIFDVLGKQVFSQQGDALSMQMDLSALATGTYLAQVQSNNKTQVVKLVKL